MKKLISILLVTVLCLGLLPAASFAWSPEDIMDRLPSGVTQPRKQSWLDESRTMYVASKYGNIIYIMTAPKKNSAKLGEVKEAESVTVYAIQKDYALAFVDSTGEGGWLNMELLIDDYYTEGPGPKDTLDVKKGVTRPENGDYFEEYEYYTVKSKNGISTVLYAGFKTGTNKVGLVSDGETVTGFARHDNSTFVKTEDGMLAWIQTKYIEAADSGPADPTDTGSSEMNSAGAVLPVSEWTDVVKLYSCSVGLLGLRSDGTVLIDRNAIYYENSFETVSYRDFWEQPNFVSDIGFFRLSADNLDGAAEEISGWRNIREIFIIWGVPFAVTVSGRVLFPDMRYLSSLDDEQMSAALNALKKAENVNKLCCTFYCLFTVEEGGRISSYPLDAKAWKEVLEKTDKVWELENWDSEGNAGEVYLVDPADVFDSNDYSNVLMYGGKALGIRNDDGTIERAGLVMEKLEEAISGWRDIEQLYMFCGMQDWLETFGDGEADLIVGVDGKGKVFAEFSDCTGGLGIFGEYIKQEVLTWKNLAELKTWACFDGGTAQIIGIMDDGSARVFNGGVYDSDYSGESFILYKNVSDAMISVVCGCDSVVLLHKDGTLSINAFDEIGTETIAATASCSKKLVALCGSSPYYGIAADGTVGYIAYRFPDDWDY